jgi:hypothetical protein
MRIVKISEQAELNRIETFDNLWKHTVSHYTSKICIFPCPCLNTIPPFVTSWQIENEENKNWKFDAMVAISWFLNNTDFMSIIQVCRKFYSFSLNPSFRKYACKHDDYTWLCESISKEAKFIFGDPAGKNASRKLGLKGLVTKIHERKLEYLHGYHTCMNESLNHVKMGGGGITRKELNQWQTFGSRSMYQVSHINTGREIQTIRLHDALGIPLNPGYIEYLHKQDIQNRKTQEKKSSHAYKKQQQNLRRQTTLKRKERLSITTPDRAYKRGKQETQPLFDNDEISCPINGLMFCPLVGTDCTHTKGFKGMNCFQNHMRKKHPDDKLE